MTRSNVAREYSNDADRLSLEGLDDFLDGLLDELFAPDGKSAGGNTTPGVVRAFKRSQSLQIIQTQEFVEQSVTAGNTTIVPAAADEIWAEDHSTQSVAVVQQKPGIFAASPETPSILSSRPSIFEGDSAPVAEFTEQLENLESQLTNKNEALRDSLNRIAVMEEQLRAKDAQLAMMPELVQRSVEATRYEHELDELREQLEDLSRELLHAQGQLNTIKSNWLGRLSLWISGAD